LFWSNFSELLLAMLNFQAELLGTAAAYANETELVLLILHCVSKKPGHLRYFQISPTKLGQYQYFLVQRIANKCAPTDAYNFAICCKTENQLRLSTGNQSRGWRKVNNVMKLNVSQTFFSNLMLKY